MHKIRQSHLNYCHFLIADSHVIDKVSVSALIRQNNFAARSAVLCCFNLMEAYLNGIAWDYVQTHDVTTLSNRRRQLLEDTHSVSIRDKLKKYPRAITDKNLWQELDRDFNDFIDMMKPFRDSLVHPSPFSTPAKFGSYDKLRMFYRIDYDTALSSTNLLVKLLKRIHLHVHKSAESMPEWFNQLEKEVEAIEKNEKSAKSS